MNSGLGIDEPSASSTRWAHCDQLCSAIYELPPPCEKGSGGPTGMTSLPMPSAGIMPNLRLDLTAAAAILQSFDCCDW